MKNRIAAIIIAMVLLCGAAPFGGQAYALTGEPVVEGEGACLIDATTGDILWEKNGNTAFEPASTTKIMTCILALENLQLTDMTYPADAEILATEGSSLKLQEGETMTVSEMLYGLMLPSANDAAKTLGKTVSGSTEAFVALMNQKAAELGCQGTHFVNPNGLTEEGHVSTAYDLALITKYALQNETFRQYVTTVTHTIPATVQSEARELKNTNLMLYDESKEYVVDGMTRYLKYEGITGVKTGYTPSAGGCLVASAERGGNAFIAVSMKSTEETRFTDCISMLDWAFNNYYTYQAVDAKTLALDKAKIRGGARNSVEVYAEEDMFVTVPAEASSEVIRTEVIMKKHLPAPVEEGQQVGYIAVYELDEEIGRVPILAAADVAEGGPLSVIGISDTMAKILLAALIAMAVLLLALTIIVLNLRRKARKRKQAKREARARELARQRAERQRSLEERDWRF